MVLDGGALLGRQGRICCENPDARVIIELLELNHRVKFYCDRLTPMGFNQLLRMVRDGLTRQTPEQAVQDKEHSIRLATMAALLEIAYADKALSLEEETHLMDLGRQMFGLTADETRELIEAADEMRTSAIDHFAITDLLRRSSSLEERIEIVKTMWRIVYADGDLHQYEGYLVRKLADLLGLEHHVMITAKLAVQQELGRAI